jgi:hypothetical protein
VALLLARIPDPKLQGEATEAILKGHAYYQKGGYVAQFVPLSYREAEELVHAKFMLRLRGAPFRLADAELVPAAGPCTTCPKRTGNQPELFGDVKSADVCTDPPCFEAKRAALWDREKVQARAAGKVVLPVSAGRKIFNPYHMGSSEAGGVTPHTGYVNPGGKIPGTGKTFSQVLKGEKPVGHVVRHPKTGKLWEVWKVEDIAEKLKAAKVKADLSLFKALNSGARGTAAPPRIGDYQILREATQEVTAELASIARKMTPETFIRAMYAALACGIQKVHLDPDEVQAAFVAEQVDILTDFDPFLGPFGLDAKPFLKAARARLTQLKEEEPKKAKKPPRGKKKMVKTKARRKPAGAAIG